MASTTHYLKTHPEPFAATGQGVKRHETRKADRDFKEGDHVVLREFNPDTQTHTGQFQHFRIGHVSPPGSWGLPADICVFTLLEEPGI